MLAWIGETLGGGSIFNRPGVNERRLRIDVVYGDKNMLGDPIRIGGNGESGEFGVSNLLYSDIFCFISFMFESKKKIANILLRNHKNDL